MEYFSLSNGIKLPVIGFGPGALGYTPKPKNYGTGFWSLFPRAYNKFIKSPCQRKEYIDAIANAIRLGFTLLDYSASYGDGTLLKEAIKRSGIKRENLILTTRISNKAQFQGEKAIEEQFYAQLKGFGIEYFDILMFHWPVTGCFESTWKIMVKLYRQGLVKTLGVANCHEHHLQKLFSLTEERPVINQFEVHPLFTQKKLITFCKTNGICVESYTPIARFDDRLMRLPVLKKIGNKYNKSVLQVILRWHIQCGLIPVVRTLNISHQKENIDIFDFVLSTEEMLMIDKININARVRYDPDNCDFSVL